MAAQVLRSVAAMRHASYAARRHAWLGRRAARSCGVVTATANGMGCMPCRDSLSDGEVEWLIDGPVAWQP
jgi:hypothetical protein